MRRLSILVAVLAAMLLLAALTSRPPAPLPASADPDRFSAGRAMADIRQIARAPHPTGSKEDGRVRAYLIGRLQALGLTVRTQDWPLSLRARERLAHWREPAGPAVQASDIVGVLAGRDRAAPAILLMAHHDTVEGSPGAADDSAGVASILETLRALKTAPQARRDLVVLFTDAEELNSDGAAGFFRGDPLAGRIGVVVNLEARGGGGRALMFETGPANGAMVGLFAHAVAGPSANSTAVLVYKLLPNVTDFSIPKAMGLPGFNFAFLGRPGLYHAPQATPAAIDAGSVQHMGGELLDLVRALAAAPALPPRGPDAVFSDVLGLRILTYPAWGGWIVVAAAAGLIGVAGFRAARAEQLSGLGLASGVGMPLGGTLVVAVVLQVANALSGAGAHANYYGRLAAIPRLEVQAALIAFAGLAALAARGPRLDERGLWGEWLGFAGLVLVIAAAVQVAAPAAGPLFAWPLLLAAACAALTDPGDLMLCGQAAIRTAIIAIVGAAFVLDLAHLAFLAVGADMPGAMALFAMLVALMIWPLLRGAAPAPIAAAAAVLLLVAGLGVAVSVRLSPPAPTIPVYARMS